MRKNVLIADDSALMRKVLSDIIEKDHKFQVAGIARNGASALQMIKEHSKEYDVILLDFFMPDMNADELLVKLNQIHLEAKVILISGILKEDAMELIHALEHGAFDFVMKPDNFSLNNQKGFGNKLIKRMELAVFAEDGKRAVSKDAGPSRIRKQNLPTSIDRKPKKGSVRGKKLIALACSTGGPKALHQVVPNLPENIDAPMLIVQHMPVGFTKSLADRLNETSRVKVKEAEDGDILEKGHVYIAKGGAQLRVKQDKGKDILRVTDEPARNGLRPCADIMYESLVGSDYDEITCVVLTGMGGDGTAGIKKLNTQNDIYSITQTAETCTVYGMPKVFYESGLADEILPLKEIADAIRKHVGVR